MHTLIWVDPVVRVLKAKATPGQGRADAWIPGTKYQPVNQTVNQTAGLQTSQPASEPISQPTIQPAS